MCSNSCAPAEQAKVKIPTHIPFGLAVWAFGLPAAVFLLNAYELTPILSLTCMNSHVRHCSNGLVLSVVVRKIMGGTLGMDLVDATHRYAGVTPHLPPGPSPWLRHTTPADGAYAGSYKALLQHTEGQAPPW